MAHPSLYERRRAHPYQQQSLQMSETYVPLSAIPNMSDRKPKLSRLELMKQNYEKKRQKDFEEKLTELRAQPPRTDSGKAHSGGTVRAFFAERRAMEASKRGQQDPSSLPPIGIHFKKMKSTSHILQGPVVQRTSQRKENKPSIPTEIIHMTRDAHSGNRGFVKYHRKKSKGVDKQNPLPSLQRGPYNTNIHTPPTPNRRYETHNTLQSEDIAVEEANQSNHLNFGQKNIVHQRDMIHVPQPPKKPKSLRTNQRTEQPVSVENTDIKVAEEESDSWSLCSNEPPPNLAKLKALRMKRLSQRKLSVENAKPEKPTEFQKWQMQQDQERQERLENHRNKNQSENYTDNEQKVTLSMRERELLERIQAEQNKLSKIKKMQQELEDQETFERENSNAPVIKLSNKKNRGTKEEEDNHVSHVEKPPTPSKTTPPTPLKIDNQERLPLEPKNVKPKPKPQIVKKEIVEPEEPQESFISFYEQAVEQPGAKVDLDLSPCSICGRNFATERLSKHEVVCLKNSNSKRKKFDGQKQRVAGTDHERFVLNGQHKKETPKAKRADWRVQHDNFIKAIRYAKGSNDEPPPVTENPHYVACPYCERKFNPDTAERHIPRCKDTKARPAPPKTNTQRRKR